MNLLLITAASIGFLHALLGADHYLPFIVLAKSRQWSIGKTISVTLGCGLGHILGSVILGLIGIAFGLAVGKIEAIESWRGSLAAWLLIAFGLVYFVWGVRAALKNRIHTHNSLTPWALFIIFVLGPCEPLIPFLMYPAATNNLWGIIPIVIVFGAATLITMLSLVIVSYLGLHFLPIQKYEKYTHATAGLTILLCGVGMKFFGL